MSRRQVRVARSFFDILDVVLPEDRRDGGTPTAADFLSYELPPIMELLAEDFEGNTLPVPDLPTVRVIVRVGVLVSRVAVYAALADDDAVELLDVALDL